MDCECTYYAIKDVKITHIHVKSNAGRVASNIVELATYPPCLVVADLSLLFDCQLLELAQIRKMRKISIGCMGG